MSLFELIDNSKTDKNTAHSYLELYEKLFLDKKYSAKNILEIGIGDGNQGNGSSGGSIKLWNDYFVNATIHASDILNLDKIWDKIKNSEKIILYTSVDAYNEDFFNKEFLFKNKKFDVIIDDGPHTLESMIQFIKLYSKVMEDNGILVIEDIPSIDWINILKNETPDHLKKYIYSYDLRENKNRFDDIVFTINKNNL